MTILASQQLWIGLGIVGFLFVSLTMILIVLIQKPQGGGLSGAFGSSSDGGAGQTAFGAKTGDVLTTMTITIFIVFLLSAAGLNYVIRPPASANATPAATGTNQTGTTPAPATPAPTTPAPQPSGINPTPIDGPPGGIQPSVPSTGNEGEPGTPESTPPSEDAAPASDPQGESDDTNPEG